MAGKSGGKSGLRWAAVIIIAGIAIGAYLIAQGSDSGGAAKLTEAKVKRLLRHLPYGLRFRPVRVPDGADGAVAGTAYGSHRAILHFGISLGPGYHPVRLPGRADPQGYGGSTFVVTDDTMIRDAHGRLAPQPRLKTGIEWTEASEIVVAIQETLCRASTDGPCEI